MRFVIGIDGGGTSCRAAVATVSGAVVGRAVSGPANIRTDLTSARANIVDAVRRAFAEAGHDPELMREAVAVLGLAGSNVGTYKQQLEAILPFRRSAVETDAVIALEGAVGDGDGAIAVLGTGTAYLSRKAGRLRPVGGWGFMIGDQASGARLGRDLLEETLLAHDGIRPGSALTQAILAVFRNDPRDVVEFTTNAKPGDFGGFAPKVFEHATMGDIVAETIIARAVAAIEASVAVLGLEPGDPLCLLGGLAPLYEPRLPAGIRAHVRPAWQDALGGAVAMALRLDAESGDAKRSDSGGSDGG